MIKIEDKSRCCGCSACVQKCPKQCISLIADDEGFLYPKVDESVCIDCGLCNKICPLQHEANPTDPIKVLSAYNNDEQARLNSSSGGIFTLLAEKTIKQGGVVFGARFDNQWNVTLDYTETICGLKVFRSSKYVQATVGETYLKCEQFLLDGRHVLFSGTPCQIAGLKGYLRKEYDNLITVDILCHGVPSPMIWQKYLQEITLGNTIQSIIFRDKTTSWKDYRFVVITEDKQHSVNEHHTHNIFMKTFLSELIVRPSCFVCPFRGTNHRLADISIGDFWGIQHIQPEMDDDKGTSILLLNTPKGIQALNDLKLICKQIDLSVAAAYNSSLQDSIIPNPRRNHFFESIINQGSVIKQMQIHQLSENLYYKAVTPLYRRLINSIRCRINNYTPLDL